MKTLNVKLVSNILASMKTRCVKLVSNILIFMKTLGNKLVSNMLVSMYEDKLCQACLKNLNILEDKW